MTESYSIQFKMNDARLMGNHNYLKVFVGAVLKEKNWLPKWSKQATLKGKNLLPFGSKFFSLRVAHNSKEFIHKG